MKILRIKFDNIGLFKKGLTIDFTAKDRVSNKSQVIQISNSIYIQKLIGLVGINASGKSMALKLLKMAMDILLGHKSLDQIQIPRNIVKNNTQICIDFFHGDKFYRMESVIGEMDAHTDNDETILYFKDEKIYSKNKSSAEAKKTLFDYSDKNVIYTRKQFEQQKLSVLKPVDSIVIAITKNERVFYADMIQETNINLYRVKGKAQIDFINLFDDSIKSLSLSEENLEVCFKSNIEAFECANPLLGNEVLSSGTIKGGNLIYKANLVLKSGGYLLVDEIEIHMHKELVLTIMDFFNDAEVNKFGATLIFTTHYSEILDAMDRKDNIYVMIKQSDYTCEAVRYSERIKRNDIKKSDIFISNYINGTAPSYESIEKVRKFICQN